MGTWIATIILAMLGVVAGYNVLHNSGSAIGIINTSATGSASIISALEGK